jgi:hypothetical protein
MEGLRSTFLPLPQELRLTTRTEYDTRGLIMLGNERKTEGCMDETLSTQMLHCP